MVPAWLIHPTRSRSGPALSRTARPTPSSSSSARLPAVRHSPHTFWRGETCRSTKNTRHPAWASRIAVEAPAGPAPITSASTSLVIRVDRTRAVPPRVPCRQETVGKRQKAGLAHLPAARALGPSIRQLTAGKSRRDALDRIAACDCIRPEKTDEPAADTGEQVPARFACDECIASARDSLEQHAQVVVLEVMQK